ncbi:MAG: helix-turn-helix domain-containing protein, partial [Coprobacillus sp.]
MAITDTLKAISDPVRRNILDLLKDGKMSAGDIAEKFNLTQATVSY